VIDGIHIHLALIGFGAHQFNPLHQKHRRKARAKVTSHQFYESLSFREKGTIVSGGNIHEKCGLKAGYEKVYKALTVTLTGNKKGASPCRRAPFKQAFANRN
jgi:hypothetical protein